MIATTCPAVVGYVERYFPTLVDSLAPIVSPMVATARVVRRLHGPDMGWCSSGRASPRKTKPTTRMIAGEVDAVLTFRELRELFAAARSGGRRCRRRPTSIRRSAAAGRFFPSAAECFRPAGSARTCSPGRSSRRTAACGMVEAIGEFATGDLDAALLESLCCKGCIMGAGIENELPLFSRRRRVREFVCEQACRAQHAAVAGGDGPLRRSGSPPRVPGRRPADLPAGRDEILSKSSRAWASTRPKTS